MKLELELDEIYTIKLNSGEELVAKIREYNKEDDYLSIENPVSIAPGPQGMGLVPSMFTGEIKEKIRLNIKSISLFAHTDSNVKTKYLQATTGISIPDKKIILG